MSINTDIQKLIRKLKQARANLLVVDKQSKAMVAKATQEVEILIVKLVACQEEIIEGINAEPESPKPRKPRSDKGKKKEKLESLTYERQDIENSLSVEVVGITENPQQGVQEGQGKPRKRKVRESIVEGEMTPEKAAASRVKVHILCPGCKEGATCVKVYQEASDCWEAKDLIQRRG